MSGCSGCDEISLPIPSNGVDGESAFTKTTSPFTQPSVGGSVVVNTSDLGQLGNGFANKGQVLRITDGTDGGWYEVNSVVSTTQLNVKNLGYTGSSSPGAIIPSDSNVSPSGPKGADGTNGTGTPGAAGADGTTRIYEYLGVDLKTPTVGISTWTPVSPAYNIPANTLVNDGDAIKIEYISDRLTAPFLGDNIIAANSTRRRVIINGSGVVNQSLTSNPTDTQEPVHWGGEDKGGLMSRTVIELIKSSSTDARVRVTADLTNGSSMGGFYNPRDTVSYEKTITGFDFTTAYSLSFDVLQMTANYIRLKSITIDKITS